MVLGDVIGVEARALVGLDDLQALAIELLVRTVTEVEVIEDAELHGLARFAALARNRAGACCDILPHSIERGRSDCFISRDQ